MSTKEKWEMKFLSKFIACNNNQFNESCLSVNKVANHINMLKKEKLVVQIH